jgi:hypothetical protein
MQLKSFCGIPTITLNNWNEGREKELESELSRKLLSLSPARGHFPQGTE